MIASKEYPECPECDRITYPTFDHETGKPYYKCYYCGYDSRKEER
jgi:Zn ribbon nucleic-acid-binding protein